jgi:acetate kinase
LGGLDALVFTGGVGEGSAEIRDAATAGMQFIGIAVSSELNAAVAGDGEITLEGSRVRTLVIHAREDLEIARQVRAVLKARYDPT